MSENSENKNPLGSGPKFNIYWIYGIFIFFFIGFNILYSYNKGKEISLNKLDQYISESSVEKIEVIQGQNYAYIYLNANGLKKGEHEKVSKDLFKSTSKGPHYKVKFASSTSFEDKYSLKAQELGFQYLPKDEFNWMGIFLSYILPFLLLLGLWYYLMKRVGGPGGGPGGQIFNIGKSKATLFDKDTKVSVTFQDVAGLDEAKEEVMEVVDFLKTPKKYTALGGKIPKGVLLVGPPGTGKTLLAKAVAGEAGVPFFSISGSDFVEMFVGVGASRVRDLFRQAKEKAPCIIFIDEIDAIGRSRGRNSIQGGNDERENTLNQLLVEMDGFGTDKAVIIMAATNRSDVLDSALLRPGRFDRTISVDKPDLVGREQIFSVHLKPLKVDESVSSKELATMTPGFAGAEIANICNEAALFAARKGKEKIDISDFNAAIDRIIGGLEKKNKLISPSEKRIIAYHEAGHAICGWYLEYASPLVKVTIVPRGIGTLGYAQYLPKENYITTYEQLLDQMCMTLGGRAAEFNTFGRISTGAQSDLDQVTKMALAMTTVYGMNDKIGNVSYYDLMQKNMFDRPYSEETAKMIDEEIRSIIDKEYVRAKKLLKDKANELEILANELLNKEVLSKADLERLIGKRPFDEEIPAIELGEKAGGEISGLTAMEGDLEAETV